MTKKLIPMCIPDPPTYEDIAMIDDLEPVSKEVMKLLETRLRKPLEGKGGMTIFVTGGAAEPTYFAERLAAIDLGSIVHDRVIMFSDDIINTYPSNMTINILSKTQIKNFMNLRFGKPKLKCRTCKSFREPAKCINHEVANRGYPFGVKKSTDLRRTEMQIIDRLDKCDYYEKTDED